MKYIFTKIFLSFISIILLFSIFLFYFLFNTTKEHYIENFLRDLTNLNVSISNNVSRDIYFKDTTALRNYINELGKTLVTRITVIGTDGRVLADSRANPNKMDNHLGRPEIQEALKYKFGKSSRYSKTVHNEMLYVATEIFYQDKFVGFVRTSYYLDYMNSLYNKLIYKVGTYLILLIIIIIIASYFISDSISKPIKLLSKAIKNVASGNFNNKVIVKGKNELTELSINFNYMAEELESLFQQVNQQKNEFINLLSSIPDGICVMDKKGVILYTNDAFAEIFPPKKYNGLHFKEILNSIKFEKFIQKNKNSEETKFTELEFNNKYYRISLSFINSRDELILVFHDITESKRLEKVKKDFILNVSHELKTPLTAIKGFIETMEEDVKEPQLMRFIQIIRRNTDRLINIVQDLLLLSELEDEEMSNKLMLTNIDLKIIIENIKLLFEQKLTEKNLYLNVEIEDGIPKVQIDSYRFEQVFVNLINNSIKFTENGGITIKIIRLDSDKIQIDITDTGAGIPEEDQDRIFERFYISEKSRSKKFGGTGIGLSIVKHIIMLHQGTICLDKNYKNGSKFIITIPIEQKK